MKKIRILVLTALLCLQNFSCMTVYGEMLDESFYQENITPPVVTETASYEAEDSSEPTDEESLPDVEAGNRTYTDSITEDITDDSVPSDISMDESAVNDDTPEALVIDDSSTSASIAENDIAVLNVTGPEEDVGSLHPISLNESNITMKGTMSFTGNAIKPVPTVKVQYGKETRTLKNNTDFQLNYKNNVYPGKATVTIKGIGQYTGSVAKTFSIKAPISKAKISYKAVIAASTGDKNVPVLLFQDKTLKEGKQYKLTKTEKQNGDSYITVTYKITGVGYYTGTVTKSYTRIRNTETIQSGRAYKLIPLLDTKTCIGVGSLTWENTALYVRQNSSSAESRKFIFKNCGNGKWSIINQCNDFVWTGKNADTSLSQTVVSRLSENQSAYQFTLTENMDGSFSFLNAKSGYAVQIRNTKQAEGSDLYLNKRNAKAVSQKFYIVPVSATKHTYTGTYQVSSSVRNNFVWSVQKGKKANTTNICIAENKNLPSQKFRLLYSGNGTYRIQCAFSYSMLDVSGAKFADFTNVQQYEWNGTDAQKWKVNKNSDGTYTFLSAGNNTYAVDLYAGKAVENGNIDIYRTNGTKAQKWNLVKTSDIFPARPTSDELRYKVTGDDIVAYAKTWVGKISYTLGANGPLVAGGKSDCSWFIFRVLEHFGLMENWHKSLEYGRGTVPNTKLVYGGIANAKPGDILVWDEGPDTGHVTIYAGNNMAVGCNGITNVTGQVEYRWYTEPCGRNPDFICRLTNLA